MDIFSYLLGKQQGGSSGGDRDWSEIGYSSEPSSIQDGFDYAKNIYDNWNNPSHLVNKFNNDCNLMFMPLVNTSNAHSFNNAFANCKSLIYLPLLDTSNVTEFYYAFFNCSALQYVPSLDFSKGTDFESAFSNCSSLKEVPNLNFSSATSLFRTFQACINLKTLPKINASNVTRITEVVGYSSSSGGCIKLENLGGFENLGQAFSTSYPANHNYYTLMLSVSDLITHDSLMNVINNLYDIATKGCKVQRLVIGATNLAKLSSAEIAIATNKGWTVE